MRVNYYVDVTISTNETFFQVFFIIIYIFFVNGLYYSFFVRVSYVCGLP